MSRWRKKDESERVHPSSLPAHRHSLTTHPPLINTHSSSQLITSTILLTNPLVNSQDHSFTHLTVIHTSTSLLTTVLIHSHHLPYIHPLTHSLTHSPLRLLAVPVTDKRAVLGDVWGDLVPRQWVYISCVCVCVCVCVLRISC